jgi:hypothetical protein
MGISNLRATCHAHLMLLDFIAPEYVVKAK